MKNYRKIRTNLKKTMFLSIWTAVFVFAASLVLMGCTNQAGGSVGGSYQKTKITINYNSDELTVEKWDASAKKWEELPPNTPVDEDTHLFFKAKNVPSGKTVDKWLLNNGKKEVEPKYLYSVRAEDAVDEAGKKVIKVERILKDAASITIEYDESLIKVGKIDLATNEYSPVPTGTTVYEGSTLIFATKDGHPVTKWILNGKREVGPHVACQVDSEDAVVEGDKKVIRVTFK